MKICKSVIHSLTLVFWIAGGCGNGSDSTDPIELRQGDFVLNFDTDTLTLTLERLDQPVLVLDAESFSLGRVDAPDDETNYDPWPLLAWNHAGAAKQCARMVRDIVEGDGVEGAPVVRSQPTLVLPPAAQTVDAVAAKGGGATA